MSPGTSSSAGMLQCRLVALPPLLLGGLAGLLHPRLGGQLLGVGFGWCRVDGQGRLALSGRARRCIGGRPSRKVDVAASDRPTRAGVLHVDVPSDRAGSGCGRWLGRLGLGAVPVGVGADPGDVAVVGDHGGVARLAGVLLGALVQVVVAVAEPLAALLPPVVGGDADAPLLEVGEGLGDPGLPLDVALLGADGQLHVVVLAPVAQGGLHPGGVLGQQHQVDRLGDSQLAAGEHGDHMLGQLEDAGVLGDLRLADPQPLGEAALGEQLLAAGALAVQRLLVGPGFLQRGQALAAEVLPVHGGEPFGGVVVADLGGHLGQPGGLGGGQSPVAEHQLVA
ncbi:MAG TPA: hypothetical protein VGS14_11225, partial [Actinomycetes bacterium]|nr:hypothetical protein [Actinomycetes bacterium]